jgi:RND family efflux transporter MFP subunit
MIRWSHYCLLWLGVLPALSAAAGFDATVGFARRLELGVPVSGVVKTVGVEPGARATKGQLLVALDDTPFKAAVAQAQAELTQRQADATETARDQRQAQELYERKGLSSVELENSKLKAQRAEAARQEAEARLTQARYAVSVATIRAPFDALVLELRTAVGASIASQLEARPLIVIAAQNEYLARARVSGEQLDALKVGQALTVAVKGKRYPGKLQSLALEPSAAGHEVVVSFTAADMLRAGQSARVDLP